MTIQEIIDLLESRKRELNAVIKQAHNPILRAQLNGHIAELQSLMDIFQKAGDKVRLRKNYGQDKKNREEAK